MVQFIEALFPHLSPDGRPTATSSRTPLSLFLTHSFGSLTRKSSESCCRCLLHLNIIHGLNLLAILMLLIHIWTAHWSGKMWIVLFHIVLESSTADWSLCHFGVCFFVFIWCYSILKLFIFKGKYFVINFTFKYLLVRNVVNQFVGSLDAKFTFTWCLHINVSLQCVDTTTLQLKNLYPQKILNTLNNQSFWIFCAIWCHIAHAPPTTTDGLSFISIFPPSAICIMCAKAVLCWDPPRKREMGLSFKDKDNTWSLHAFSVIG